MRIQVNGEVVSIGLSLYSALKQLRRQDTDGVFWIDQLCIDQTNIAEKTRQVQLMSRIYSGCSRCLAWLGEIPDHVQADDVKWLFDAFHYLVAWNVARGSGQQQSLPPAPDTISQRYSPQGPHKALGVLLGAQTAGIESSSWWRRIWTVQEAALPHRILFMLGPLSLPWEMLSAALQHLTRAEYPPVLAGFLRSKYNVHMPDLISHSAWISNNKTPLYYPLHTFFTYRMRDATDPRDKVYALLGLTRRDHLPRTGKCDYSLSVGRVLTNLTVDLIQHEKGLRPLISGLRTDSSKPTIPSWTFNVSHDGDYGTDWHSLFGYNSYAACGPRELDLESFLERMDREPDVLQVYGSFADKVAHVGRCITESRRARKHQQRSDSEYRSCFAIWKLLGQQHHRQPSTFEQDFARTLIGDLVRRSDQHADGAATMNHVDMVHQFLAGHGMRDNGKQSTLRTSIRHTTSNQAFFVTQNGLLGLGPPDTKRGDEIWVLDGGKMPFTLKPRRHGEKKGEDEFVDHARGDHDVSQIDGKGKSCSAKPDFDFGGACYVHGLMSGQLVNGVDAEPEKRMLKIH